MKWSLGSSSPYGWADFKILVSAFSNNSVIEECPQLKRRKYPNFRCVVSFAIGLTLLGVIKISAVSLAVADPSDPIGDQND